MMEQTSTNWVKEIGSLIFYILIIIALTYIILTYVGQRTVVSGESMYSTLEDGDNLIVDKLTYRFKDIERFDIVVFLHEDALNGDAYYIKRIIGLPGETIKIEGDNIYINGELLEESYGYEPMDDAGIAEDEIVLGEDEYFVLGDNRNASKDSRDPDVGKVSKSLIEGRAILRIYPFSKFGTIDK
jgi:signal peptidase I